MFVSLVQR